MFSPKIVLYTLLFSCLTFVYTATQGGFIGMNMSPIQVPLLLSLGYVALAVTFFGSFKGMETKLKIVGTIYCVAGLLVSFVVMTPFIPSLSDSASSFFLFLYLAALLMIGTFYLTYFWIAIRADMTINAAIVLIVLSAVMIFWPAQVFGRGTIAETNLIGFPALIVSLIAYFRARRVIKARNS